jgi:cobalamin biosynthesis Mg chelatase CobN
MANPNRVSLGQVAAQYKAAKSATNARTLTNQDVEQMLSNKTGVTTARNMPPLGPAGSMPGGATQSSASPSNTAPSQPQSETAQASSSAAQSSSPAQSSVTGQQTGTPPPAGATQGQSAGSEATANSSTTPKINPNQQSNDAQGKSKLPATATLLPLLGLLGLASGGVGLWFRKFRK